MFYVRHIEPGHDEVIYEATWVRFTRATGSSEPPAGLHLRAPCGASIYLGGGTAYVMNEGGKTVGKYNIDTELQSRQPTAS